MSLFHQSVPTSPPFTVTPILSSHRFLSKRLSIDCHTRLTIFSLKKMLWPLSYAKLPITIRWIQSQIWSFLENNLTTVLLSFPRKTPWNHSDLKYIFTYSIYKVPLYLSPICHTVSKNKNYLWVFHRHSQTPLRSHYHSKVFYATPHSLHHRDYLVLLTASYYTLRYYRVYHHSKQIGFHCVDHWAQSSNADSKAIC